MKSYANSTDAQPESTTDENHQEPDFSSAAQKGLLPKDTFGEVNMEAPVTADDVVRAGGFGASDNFNSILPVASDSTDFEAHLQTIQDYEDSMDNKAQGQTEGNDKNIDSVEEKAATALPTDSDYLARAGGYGATDNISSFLPVASDFTDFEASLRDARDYEDLKEEITRHGLGWTGETK